ncbi:MAG: histidine phosphatase family protein [Jiangellaceae bacterium]
MAAASGPELWLVRHGETEWSRDGKHTGTTDLPLTPVGEDAARSLGAMVAHTQFDLVLSSPLRRAFDTAVLAGFTDPVIEPNAREWVYGDYEGITTDQIRAMVPGWRIWTHGAPGGESPDEVGARADKVVDRVRTEALERALIFAHGHFLRVLAARWLGLPAARGVHLRLDTSTVSVLGWEREEPAIVRWNS